ncbi:MAG: dihydroorotate dehydrogenase [Oscillospiraceae bacterium]|nr:dihydroorotate dehydrogenase [Oscillospiraceae bacterium]
MDMSVDFAGVRFRNPVVAASGTFGFGREYSDFYDLSRLGGICAKGLTANPRAGNEPPRIAETPMGILNSVGLQNPGVDAFIAEELPFLLSLGTVVIANISAESAAEYADMAEKLSGSGVGIIEVNVSCPNVKAGGMQFGTSADSVREVTQAVKEKSDVPVMVKLSPNVTDISAIALAAQAGGADAISLINTITAMRIDTATGRPVLGNNTGGLSGPAVLPVAIRMVWQAASAVSIPVLGMGGVSTGDNAIEMLLAGASLVGVGTASFNDPYAPLKIIDGIAKYMERRGISRISDITGKVVLN